MKRILALAAILLLAPAGCAQDTAAAKLPCGCSAPCPCAKSPGCGSFACPVNGGTNKPLPPLLPSHEPVLMVFSASWCGPCKALAPTIDRINREFTVTRVDIDQHKAEAAKYGVKAIPRLLILVDGKVVWDKTGGQPEATIRAALLAAKPKMAEEAEFGPCSRLCVCGCHRGFPCRCRRPFAVPPPPAIPEPPVVRPLVEQAIPTGVEWDKIHGDGYSRKGKAITRAEAFEAVTTGIPDDGSKLRLTIIGPDASRAKVEADLKLPENKDIADRVLPWSVKPDHFSVRDTGFVTNGSPTVYCQAPDGKVIFREDTYEPTDFGAIRKAIATYDAAKDPGRVPPASPTNLTPIAIGAGVVLLIFLLANRKKAE